MIEATATCHPSGFALGTRPADDAASDALRMRRMVAEHFDFVWRLLRRLGVPYSDADDGAQRVFLVASTRLDVIRPGAERAFLYGTAVRVAWSDRRTRRRRREVDEGAVPERADETARPDDAFEQRRRVAMLDEILQALPEPLRAVFVLSEIEQLPCSQVAELEAIPVGTVASRLRRARQLVVEEIERRTSRNRAEGITP